MNINNNLDFKIKYQSSQSHSVKISQITSDKIYYIINFLV